MKDRPFLVIFISFIIYSSALFWLSFVSFDAGRKSYQKEFKVDETGCPIGYKKIK